MGFSEDSQSLPSFSKKPTKEKLKIMINDDEYRNEMEGIFTTCVGTATLDEAPMAYKSIDEIIEQIKPTAKIIEKIKPIYNFKAAE